MCPNVRSLESRPVDGEPSSTRCTFPKQALQVMKQWSLANAWFELYGTRGSNETSGAAAPFIIAGYKSAANKQGLVAYPNSSCSAWTVDLHKPPPAPPSTKRTVTCKESELAHELNLAGSAIRTGRAFCDFAPHRGATVRKRRSAWPAFRRPRTDIEQQLQETFGM